MLDAVNFLTSLLTEELKQSTGMIKEDMNNGSYYSIRKLVSAIRTLSEDPFDTNVTMEIQKDTWQVIIKNSHLLEEKLVC